MPLGVDRAPLPALVAVGGVSIGAKISRNALLRIGVRGEYKEGQCFWSTCGGYRFLCDGVRKAVFRRL